jgi:radical SAM protein with 4Fe4S-binding SPASM domain
MLTELTSTEEFYFQWHLTERCNKHCSHCYQNGRLAEELPLSSLGQILLHIDHALAKWERQGSISFTGGEPFVRESDLFALMTGADQTNSIAFYDILTNGSLVSDEIASKLKDFTKLRRIQVSLEGSTPEVNDAIRGRGSFEETLVAIRRMKKHGLTVSVMTTVSKLNYLDVPNIIDLLDGEGVDTFADDSDVGALCSAGNNALTIMPDGTLYPCRRLPIPIGNILTDGLFSIWYDSDILWRIRNPDNLQGKCRDCDLLAVCRGCRAMAYFCSGN